MYKDQCCCQNHCNDRWKESCNNCKCQCHHRRCQCLHKSYIIVDHVKCHDRQNKLYCFLSATIEYLEYKSCILSRITYKLSITLSPFHTSSTISSECDYISLPAVSLPDAFIIQVACNSNIRHKNYHISNNCRENQRNQ